MELNLYGVASIQLDRLKGGRMRRILGLFTAFYFAVLIASAFLPQAT